MVSLHTYPSGVPFEATDLQPGEPKVASLFEHYPAPFSVNRDDLTLTLIPCARLAGASGDGSIRFISHPEVDAEPWPTTEKNPSFKELNGGEQGQCRVPLTPGQKVTFASTAGALDGRRRYVPRVDDLSFKEEPAGAKDRCFYIDSVAMTFPGIEMSIAQELLDTKAANCWYADTRKHELEHVRDVAEAFHAMQRALTE